MWPTCCNSVWTCFGKRDGGGERGAAAGVVPRRLSPALVFADESLLVRTFNNLLLNALQSVPPGRDPRQDVRLQASKDPTRY